MKITVKALGPQLLDDYLHFFDNMVFTENPGWSKCYCYSFHFTGRNEEWNKEQNRIAVSELIKNGGMTGYLAFLDNTPIGWCNVNNRNKYQRLSMCYDLDIDPKDKAASVVCFIVSPQYRRKGIARKMLEQIINDYSKLGYDYLEAYPEATQTSSEKNYKGPMRLYTKLGFEIVKTIDNYHVVRRKL